MAVLPWYSVLAILIASVHIAASCKLGEYRCPNWSSCSKSCGGGQICRTCEQCFWGYTKEYCQNCNEHCLNGYSYVSGSCQCPSWRSGDCCEVCRHINIPHCVSGQQQCGGSPDGIMCTQCEPGYHSGGYGQGCLDTDECAAGTSGCAQQCTNTPGSYVCSCLPEYWLWTDKHTCNCKYMFIGTSGSRKTSDRAWLISPMLIPTYYTERCLQFGYNMNGPSIGLLSVFMTAHGEKPGSLLWRMSGDQGLEWKGASVELSSPEQYQIIIEAVVGNSYFGDIAIDDVAILPKVCQQQEKGLLIG